MTLYFFPELLLKVVMTITKNLSIFAQIRGDLSIDKLILPALSGSTAACRNFHSAASVSWVCGSSAYKPMSERWHPHVPSQRDPWLKSQIGGNYSCLPGTVRLRWTPPAVPSGHTCFPLRFEAPWAPRSVGCTHPPTQGCSRRKTGWSRHIQRWRHGRCGSSAPPCSS